MSTKTANLYARIEPDVKEQAEAILDEFGTHSLETVSWKYLKSSDVSTICSAVNKDTVYFKILTPAWGTQGYITFKGYVSKIEAELLDGMIGYTLSFNIIQSEGASFQ